MATSRLIALGAGARTVLANVLVCTAVILFVWLLGKWIWPVLYPDSFRPLVANFEQSRGGAEAIKANYAAWNLFGRKPASEVRQEMSQVEVPETSMQLDLHGVVVGLDSRSSGAIISERNAEANYYRMDEELPGGVVLAAVYDDRVLLDRNGVMETLSFDKDATIKTMIQQQPIAQPAMADAGAALPQTPDEFLSMAEQQLAADAPAALASVGLEPAAEGGNAEGYRFTGANPMLRSLSLRQGDVIRSVNGHVLGNVEEDRRMMKEFHQSGMLEVEVERDGAVFSISYPIP